MRASNCAPVSSPPLPPTYNHPMWHAWDLAADLCLAQLPALLADPNYQYQSSPFFAEQLTAFELWLEHGCARRCYARLSDRRECARAARRRARRRRRSCRSCCRCCSRRRTDCARWRCSVASSTRAPGRSDWRSPVRRRRRRCGAAHSSAQSASFPTCSSCCSRRRPSWCDAARSFVVRTLVTSLVVQRAVLVFIWAKLLSLDSSCQADLVKDQVCCAVDDRCHDSRPCAQAHNYFIAVLSSPTVPHEQRTQSAFVLCAIMFRHRAGQQANRFLGRGRSKRSPTTTIGLLERKSVVGGAGADQRQQRGAAALVHHGARRALERQL